MKESSVRSGTELVLLWVIRVGLFAIPSVALFVGGYTPFDIAEPARPGTSHLALPHIYFGFIAWKNFAFRMAVEVLFGLWVCLAAIAPRYRPRRSPVTIAVTALLLVIAVADVAGVAPTRSIWSNFERMQGLMGLLYLYGFFLIASSVMDKRSWIRFFNVSLGVCVLIAIDVLWVWTEPAPPGGEHDLFGGRVGGKFGSPVHLACYLLLHVFVAAFLAVRSKSRYAAISYGIVMLGVLVALSRTGTRAAYAGLAGGTAVIALLLALRSERAPIRKIGFISAASIAVVVALVGSFALFSPDAAEVLGPRFGALGERIELMFATWASAFQGFLDRPLLGWGQENFIYVFDTYYRPEFYRATGWMWNDRPHNVFFRWLVEGGILGFAAYVAVLVTGMKTLWRRSGGGFTLAERTVLTGLVAGYLVFASAQPDELLSLLLFFATMAFVDAVSAADRPRLAPGWRAPIATLPVLLIAAGVFVWWTQTYVHGPNIRAGTMLLKVQKRPRLIDRVLAEDSFIDLEAREHNLMTSMGLPKRKGIPPAVRAQLLQHAFDLMVEAIDDEPDRARTYYLLGRFLAHFRRHAEALHYFEEAARRAPRRPRFRFRIALQYFHLGQLDEARKQFRYAQDLHPHGEYPPSVSFPSAEMPPLEKRREHWEAQKKRREERQKRGR